MSVACTIGPSVSAFGIAPSNVASRLACAAKYGQAHSIGAAFGGGKVASFLGGNTVSSLLNLGLAATGNGPSPDPTKVYMGGTFQGVPVNDVLRLTGNQTIQGTAPSLSGTVRTAGLTGIFNAATESGGISSIAAEGGEIAVQGGLSAAEFASGVAVAKFGLDTLTVGYGYFFGCPK